MIDRPTFNAWLGEFGRRYPAVAEYVKRRAHQDQKLLCDTWHQTLQAFERETLDEVTQGIMSGELQPVPNVALGTFADEIRQRARQLLAKRHRNDFEPLPPPVDPVECGDMQWAVKCGVAVLELLDELGQPCNVEADYFRIPDSVQPKIPYCAAIILADKHTSHERRYALAAIEDAGLTWELVQERAKTVSANMLQEA